MIRIRTTACMFLFLLFFPQFSLILVCSFIILNYSFALSDAYVQWTLTISNSLISNNRLSRSENLVPA